MEVLGVINERKSKLDNLIQIIQFLSTADLLGYIMFKVSGNVYLSVK